MFKESNQQNQEDFEINPGLEKMTQVADESGNITIKLEYEGSEPNGFITCQHCGQAIPLEFLYYALNVHLGEKNRFGVTQREFLEEVKANWAQKNKVDTCRCDFAYQETEKFESENDDATGSWIKGEMLIGGQKYQLYDKYNGDIDNGYSSEIIVDYQEKKPSGN